MCIAEDLVDSSGLYILSFLTISAIIFYRNYLLKSRDSSKDKPTEKKDNDTTSSDSKDKSFKNLFSVRS
jgi:hypothetical protein